MLSSSVRFKVRLPAFIMSPAKHLIWRSQRQWPCELYLLKHVLNLKCWITRIIYEKKRKNQRYWNEVNASEPERARERWRVKESKVRNNNTTYEKQMKIRNTAERASRKKSNNLKCNYKLLVHFCACMCMFCL